MKKEDRNVIKKEDIELVNFIIKYKFVNNIKLSNKFVEEFDKLLWKDFLLYFKMAFSQDLYEMYTGKLSIILRQLLNIEQELHVRKGIKLTFREWLDLYEEEKI